MKVTVQRSIASFQRPLSVYTSLNLPIKLAASIVIPVDDCVLNRLFETSRLGYLS